ncbi:unnamed protein product [Phaeothamnion confervicola]
MLWAGIIAFRILNCVFLQTYFTPDEFWQGPEVAHAIAFGQGQLTWEWQADARLRGVAHPLLYVAVYRALGACGLDTAWAIAHAPLFLGGLVAAVSDQAVFALARHLLPQEAAPWALFLQLSNWFNFYCLPRPYSNCVEASLTVAALARWAPALWPKPVLTAAKSFALVDTAVADKAMEEAARRRGFFGGEVKALALAAICVAIRPSSAMLWALVGAMRLMMIPIHRWPLYLGCVVLPTVGIMLAASTAADRWFYGAWTFVPLNFLRFNVLEGSSAVFGVQPWHWNFTEGLPAMLGLSLPFFIPGAVSGPAACLGRLILFFLATHSLSPHKEWRFLLAALQLANVCAGYTLWRDQAAPAPAFGFVQWWQRQPPRRRRRMAVVAFVLGNTPLALYVSIVHQRGPLAVTAALRRELTARARAGPAGGGGLAAAAACGSCPAGDSPPSEPNEVSVHFLMPCHSTPFYSHLHVPELNGRLRLWSLDCSPSKRLSPLRSESDRFDADPAAFTAATYGQPPRRWRRFFAPSEPPKLPSLPGPDDGLQRALPDYLVLYETHLAAVSSALPVAETAALGEAERRAASGDATSGYVEVARVFNTHFNGDSDAAETYGHICVLRRADPQ